MQIEGPCFIHEARPGRVIFGWGARRAVGEELARLGVERAMIITTPSFSTTPLLGTGTALCCDRVASGLASEIGAIVATPGVAVRGHRPKQSDPFVKALRQGS